VSAYDHLRESLQLESGDASARRMDVLRIVQSMKGSSIDPGVSAEEVTRIYLKENPPEGVKPRMLRPGSPEFAKYKKKVRSDLEALVKSGALKKTVVFQKGRTKASPRGRGQGSATKAKEARFVIRESTDLSDTSRQDLRESLHLETGEPLWVRAAYREVSKWRRENDAEDLISRYDSKSGRVIVSGAPDLKARNLLGKYLQSKGFLVASSKKIKLRLYVKPGEKRLEKEGQPRKPSKPRVSKAENLKGPILKAIKNHPDEGTEWTLAHLEKKVGGSKALIRKAVKELEAEGRLRTRVRKRNTPAGGTGAVSSMFGGARVVVHKYLVIEPVIRESTEADTARQVANLKKILGKRGTRAVTAFKDWRKGAFVVPKRT
jgi:hypothetical protein